MIAYEKQSHHHQRRVGHRQMRGYHRGIILISMKESGSRYRPLGIRSLIILAGAPVPRGDFIRTGCRSAQLSGCLKIFAVAYGLQPFVGGFCARNFYGEMGKPTVRRCPVPMLHPPPEYSPHRPDAVPAPSCLPPDKSRIRQRRRESAHRRTLRDEYASCCGNPVQKSRYKCRPARWTVAPDNSAR